jgi:hypothetical protein
MDEMKLLEKLRRIEALFEGATTDGEREAAGFVRERILEKLRKLQDSDPPIEYRFTMADMWSRKVFVALLRRYDLKPYRYARQRYTTVMVRVSRGFVNETLWPEYQQISSTLREYLTGVTENVISQVIHGDHSEAAVVEEPAMLRSGVIEMGET